MNLCDISMEIKEVNMEIQEDLTKAPEIQIDNGGEPAQRSTQHTNDTELDRSNKVKSEETLTKLEQALHENNSKPSLANGHHDPPIATDIEMKFVPENKHLHLAAHGSSSRTGTPNTARRRKHPHHHVEEMNMAEMISLSGVESLCTISNYDAMSLKERDIDEENGEGEKKEEEGIGVHHVLSVILGCASVTIILLLYFLVPCPLEPTDWNIQLQSIVSRSPMRILDVNGDGMADIIFGFGIGSDDDTTTHCERFNLSWPCGGGVMALSGWRGQVIWELWTNQTAITGLVCNQLDVNEDGQLDCLASGSEGQIMAIDSKTGAIVWDADPSVTMPSWTYTQPQTLPRDLDEDGVLDLVVAHGPDLGNGQNETAPGRLILLSGKSGLSLGTFLGMPDGVTTKCPPIVYQTSDDDDDEAYIVFGSGSLTTQGSMWMISLEQLHCHVMGTGCTISTLTSDGSQPIKSYGLDHVNSDVIELVRGSGSGFEHPAIVADMTMDGVNDLIITSQNALVTALNGSSLQPLWRTQQHLEAHSVLSLPAPGHFNQDEVPDICLHLGASESSETKIVILDGLTGRELWYTASEGSSPSLSPMSSPLSLKAKEDKGAFIFWLASQPQERDSTTTQSNGDRCSDFISSLPSRNLLLMDRDVAMNPPSLFSTTPYQYNHNSSSPQPSNSLSPGHMTTSHPISTGATKGASPPVLREASPTTLLDVTSALQSKMTGQSSPLPNTASLSLSSSSSTTGSTGGLRRRRNIEEGECYKMEPFITSTGVIGDFDNDGSLEFIVAINMMSSPIIGSTPSSTVQPQLYLSIQRFGLSSALGKDQRTKLDLGETFLGPSVGNDTFSEGIMDHFDLLEAGEQTWMGYMGTTGNGRYT